MPPRMRDVNLKAGLPTVEEARALLNSELARARSRGDQVLKLIHGYGSSGVGGALKDAIRSSLRRRKKEGKIRSFIGGENWSIFDPATSEILQQHPGLERDPDLNQGNEGVTIVMI